jgi:hypothetical protein
MDAIPRHAHCQHAEGSKRVRTAMEAQPRRPGAAQDLRAAEAGCTPAQSEKVVTLVLISCPCLVASGVCAPALPRRSASHFFLIFDCPFPSESIGCGKD